ncbi:MAG TPA: hypothetical protein VM661_10265 [Candidatus Sulfotelmatobacter sp.]|jgi:hypothetical protein|nr:hypothetical protein [Candidatus Sulfotelmatobacter sp.]
MRPQLAAAALVLMIGGVFPAYADDVANNIEQARAAYAKGDALHTLSALQAAQTAVYGKLADQFGKAMPAAPAGWEASAPESQSLDSIGGGLTVTKGFTKGEATLNATLVVDNPAVAAGGAPLKQPVKAGWSKIKIGSDDALERFDSSTRSGEIMIMIADRVLLQIEGNDITKDDALLDAAKSWNIAAIRKVLGVQ